MTNFFLTCKECIIESPTNFYGCFYLGPFNSSQSLTIANGLRRTLLSEIPGLGIQSIEIEGVEHEFSTFPGIRESILDLLLNLKEIVLKYTNNEQNITFEDSVKNTMSKSKIMLNEKLRFLRRLRRRIFDSTESTIFDIEDSTTKIQNYVESSKKVNKKPLYGYLQARGPGIIRASDLKLPASIMSVDPNQYIATLTTDGVLNLRFTICEGFTSIQNPKIKYNQINKNLIEEEFSWLFESETLKKNESFYKKNSNLENPIVSHKKKFKNSKILWLDPVFTPILKVNYIIESCGSLELNPTNQVILLELWTNGSVHPRDALYKALSELNLIFFKLEKMKTLNSIFSKSILNSNKFYSKLIKKVKYDYSFYKSQNLNKLKKNLLSTPKSKFALSEFSVEKKENFFANEIKDQTYSNEENINIDSLGLPFRIKNSLINANIVSIKNILDCQIEDLKKIPGIGNQSLILLIKKLNEKGFKLKK